MKTYIERLLDILIEFSPADRRNMELQGLREEVRRKHKAPSITFIPDEVMAYYDKRSKEVTKALRKVLIAMDAHRISFANGGDQDDPITVLRQFLDSQETRKADHPAEETPQETSARLDSAANLNLDEFNRLTQTQLGKEKVWSAGFNQAPTVLYRLRNLMANLWNEFICDKSMNETLKKAVNPKNSDRSSTTTKESMPSKTEIRYYRDWLMRIRDNDVALQDHQEGLEYTVLLLNRIERNIP